MCVVVLYREWAARREGYRSPSSALRPRPLFGELGPARFHRVACLPAVGADWPAVSSDVPAVVGVGGPTCLRQCHFGPFARAVAALAAPLLGC